MSSLRIERIGSGQKLPFEPDQALSMDAFIILSDQKVSLAVRKDQDEQVVYLFTSLLDSTLSCGLKQFFFEHPILSLPYRSTQISIHDQSAYTIVPQDLFHTTTAEDWLAVVTELGDRQVLSEDISQEQMTLCYSISQELYDFCQRSFSLPSYTHTIKSLITSAILESRRSNHRLLMAEYSTGTLDLVVAEEGALLLANRYRVLGASDILYYLTSVFRQFRLSNTDDPLYLYTDQPVPQLEQELRDTIRQLHINHYPSLIVPPEHTQGIPTPFVHKLLCE